MPNRLRRARLALAAGCLGGGVLVLGASGGAGATPAAITLYSGQHVQTTQALVSAFEKKTGIKVNVRFDDEDVLANQIVEEGGHSPADAFFTENSPPLQYLASKQMLAPLAKSTLAETPAKYDSPNGQWLGISARVSVIVYNTALLKPSQLPTSAMQLSRAKWKGKIALAGGETDFQPIVTSVAHTYGNAAALKWLNGVKANAGGHLLPDNETVTDEVNRGQVALGVIDQYYWYRLRAEDGASNTHSAIAYFAPHDVGYVVDVSGAGVLRSSPHRAEAQQLVTFLASAQGQSIIAHSDSFEYPIGSHVTTAQPETPFSHLQPNAITIAQLGTGAGAINLLEEAQLL
ncbi:MAG TPA: extracellular solute-binding protein [Acidimicrobiales bacterium]|jgi:iron(III) transport system substrate-binding protein|nr:extracellular solute-binding protein [Acidimicrobiales bacterium]